MKSKKVFIYVFILFVTFVMSGGLISQTLEKDLEKDYLSIKIDGFEKEGEWAVKYSKFRSRDWDGLGTEYIPNNASNYWILWLGPDDSLKREDILANGILQNKYILPDDEKTILGVRARWDYQGLNWMTIEPAGGPRLPKEASHNLDLNDEEYSVHYKRSNPNASYIVLPGETRFILFYLWSSNFLYDLEIHLEDYDENYYVFPITELNFNGWKLEKIRIPEYVKQKSTYFPRSRPVKFMKFKINTRPDEKADGFYAYFDYLHTFSDTYEKGFVGDQLERSERIWRKKLQKNSNTNTTPANN